MKDTWSLFYERDLCSFSSSASALQALVSVWVAIVNVFLLMPCGSLLLPFSCMFVRMTAVRTNKNVDTCYLYKLSRIWEFEKKKKNDRRKWYVTELLICPGYRLWWHLLDIIGRCTFSIDTKTNLTQQMKQIHLRSCFNLLLWNRIF